MKIFWDSLKQDKYMLLGILLAVVVFITMMVAIYPGDEEAVEQISGIEEMADWEASFGIILGEGGPYRYWLTFFIFSFVGIFFVALPVLTGTTIIAKEVDNNTIDMLMGNPISKRRVFLEKLLEALAISAMPVMVLFFYLLGISWLIGQNIIIEILWAACIQLLPLVCGMTILSAFFAIIFLDTGRARRYMAVIVVGSFIIAMIVSYSKELEVLKFFQIFYYYDSPQTLLKPSFEKIGWEKSGMMVVFTLVMFGITFYFNEIRECFPHYSHEIKKEKASKKGIPLIFFYSRIFQKHFPCFVEELQSDKLLIYIMGTLMFISGIITPTMYPGDEGWIKLAQAYDMILVESLLGEHGIALNYAGYIASEGFGEFFLYLSIVAIILGPKVVFRDQKSAMIDLIFAQPIPFEQVVRQRIAAIGTEIFTLGFISIIGYTLGTIIVNDYYKYLLGIAIAILFVALVTLTMTILNTMLAVFCKNHGQAISAAVVAYIGIYLIYLLAYPLEDFRLFSQITPFHWSDITDILYNQAIHLHNIIALFIYIILILIMVYISVRKVKLKEFIG